MRSLSKLFLSAALVLTFASCKKDDADPQRNFTNTIPWLEVGHKWNYDVTAGFSSYNEIENEITANNDGLYTMGTKIDGATGANAYLYYENGFLNTFDDGDNLATSNQSLLKWDNPQVGDSWVRVTPTETYTHTLESLNESVTVPLGTFICKKVHITFQNAFNDQITYWNDSVGIIKVDNILFTLELAGKNF